MPSRSADAIEKVMLPALEKVQKEILALARAHAGTAMLARTHGQRATPTTFGKEMNVFAKRLERQVDYPQEQHHPGQMGRPIGQLQRSDGGASARRSGSASLACSSDR